MGGALRGGSREVERLWAGSGSSQLEVGLSEGMGMKMGGAEREGSDWAGGARGGAN